VALRLASSKYTDRVLVYLTGLILAKQYELHAMAWRTFPSDASGHIQAPRPTCDHSMLN